MLRRPRTEVPETAAEVARGASLPSQPVSRVIDKGEIGRETVEDVRAVNARLDYRRNGIAKQYTLTVVNCGQQPPFGSRRRCNMHDVDC